MLESRYWDRKYFGVDVGHHERSQTTVQLLTVVGVLTWWLIRASLFLSGVGVDLARRTVWRTLRRLRAVDWDEAKHKATEAFVVVGATCLSLTVTVVVITILYILTSPEAPYPRVTDYKLGGNPGPILIEFGPAK